MKALIKFRHSKSQAFYDYWCQLPKTGVLPEKKHLKPEQIPNLLATMIVYELVSHDLIRIRLMGSTVEERFGGRRTGTNYLDMVEDHRKFSASAALWAQVENSCGMYALLEQELVSGRLAYIEALGLPVSNDEGKYPVLFFQSNEVHKDNDEPREKSQQDLVNDDDSLLKYIRVVERSYFDLGMGIPELRD
ncbi:hypothetical protein WH95_02085 [Kiloniella litopenaei]|uniref:PAS domain-containing protein n=1 Tax=Kiloniella litopenaei TaxID=1549748 RepID=A0A0M2RCJ3_9PROT|nr:PAS domain-containing protein [Kiloniella litopenaei]KKJ78159.1 hypothetical protein WH95_02085 [Kiloniella litopenaei]